MQETLKAINQLANQQNLPPPHYALLAADERTLLFLNRPWRMCKNREGADGKNRRRRMEKDSQLNGCD